jgi:hypothetical protein
MSEGKIKAKEVNIIEEFNKLVDEIPFKSLRSLPEKLEPLKKYAGFLGANPDDFDDFDIADPIKRVVTFIGVLVKRLRTAEKRIESLEEELRSLKND